MRQPDILDRCLMIVERLCPYLVGAVLLLALAGMLSAQEYYSVRRGGWRREAASPYWTDPNTYTALWEMETTNATQTLDTSGNAYHASNMPNVATGPTWFETGTNTEGRVEHGYSLDDSNDAFVASQWDATPTTNFILGCWVKFKDNEDYEPVMCQWNDVATNLRTFAIARFSDQKVYAYISTNGVSNRKIASSNTVATNVWTQVCVSYNVAQTPTLKLWIDGQIQNTDNGYNTRLYNNPSQPVTLGFAPFAASLYRSHIDIDAAFISPTTDTNIISQHRQYMHPTNNMRAR